MAVKVKPNFFAQNQLGLFSKRKRERKVEMESWEVLETAIPRQQSKRVALLLGVSADYVRRWRREPESDDAPTGSGQRSILDRVCDLIDVVFLVNPKDAHLVIDYIRAHYSGLVNAHADRFPDQLAQVKSGSELLQEAVEAINKLNLEECDNETLIELNQLRSKTDEAIAAVRKTMLHEA